MASGDLTFGFPYRGGSIILCAPQGNIRTGLPKMHGLYLYEGRVYLSSRPCGGIVVTSPVHSSQYSDHPSGFNQLDTAVDLNNHFHKGTERGSLSFAFYIHLS